MKFLILVILKSKLYIPGHTLESTCYLLIDSNNTEYCIFTGDTLFIGDVGRPDLAVKKSFNAKRFSLNFCIIQFMTKFFL